MKISIWLTLRTKIRCHIQTTVGTRDESNNQDFKWIILIIHTCAVTAQLLAGGAPFDNSINGRRTVIIDGPPSRSHRLSERPSAHDYRVAPWSINPSKLRHLIIAQITKKTKKFDYLRSKFLSIQIWKKNLYHKIESLQLTLRGRRKVRQLWEPLEREEEEASTETLLVLMLPIAKESISSAHQRENTGVVCYVIAWSDG